MVSKCLYNGNYHSMFTVINTVGLAIFVLNGAPQPTLGYILLRESATGSLIPSCHKFTRRRVTSYAGVGFQRQSARQKSQVIKIVLENPLNNLESPEYIVYIVVSWFTLGSHVEWKTRSLNNRITIHIARCLPIKEEWGKSDIFVCVESADLCLHI